MMTITEHLTTLERDLRGVSDVPRVDAERLLVAVLGKADSSWLYAHGDEVLSPAESGKLTTLLADRLTGKTLAYVLGEWGFYGRTFTVDERVLVPRPETEELVDQALAWLRAHPQARVVADIGTGSGVIAITLALESDVEIIATDVSAEALRVAKENARRHGVEGRITFLEGDMLEPLKEHEVDLIVSNPPYVPTAELDAAGSSLETIGLQFEPRVALDGGVDGQDYIKKIIAGGIPAIIEGVGGEIIAVNL